MLEYLILDSTQYSRSNSKKLAYYSFNSSSDEDKGIITYKKKNNISVINQESNCKSYNIMNSS